MALGRTLIRSSARPPRDRHGQFVNYSRTVRVRPAAWHSPTSEEQVCDLVSEAARGGRRVRVVGAGHSWNPIAAPEDIAVNTAGLRGLVELGEDSVTVRAGTRLGELNRLLAEHGRNLPILSSICQQSVAGAIGTATHGSSLEHGSLSSLVLGARLVSGDGSVHRIGDGDERLDAVRVHLGALGVLTEVTLATTPAFAVAETIERVPVGEVSARVAEFGRSSEFVKVWWMPHTPSALVFRYERTDERRTRLPSPETQRFVENWLPRAIMPPLYAWHERRSAGVPRFNRVATRWLDKGRRVGPSTVMLTTPDPIRHYETEAAVPLEAGGEAFDRTVGLIDRLGVHVNFILELRYGRRETAWLSPAHGRDVVHLAACTGIASQKRPYFDAFWQDMRRLGGRPHWGKEMEQEAGELAALYPDFGRFVEARNVFDPHRVFANAHLGRILGA